MKLSAPPPPPPPPEQPTPGGQPDEQPDALPPAAGAATPEVPPPPAPAPASRILQWPGWYPGVDSVLAALVLLFAFGAASFVARNSDVWVHLASGKRLFAGQYTPGTDPFSYSAADRPWVNHSWLADAVGYLLYGGQGKVLVIAKALVVALAFGLLIAIRRPRFSLWPWAATACVAVLACAPYLTLRPQVVSMLFLALTLYLLFRAPHRPNSWRFPAAIGVTFWLWANCDPWFFVGPLALALVVVGDLIQARLLNSPEAPPAQGAADDEPLGRMPDTLTLAKALGIGVLACMLNPHHVRVWELPFELTGGVGTDSDPRLRLLVLSPTDGDYFNAPGLGYNLNGLAYAVLFVAGAVVLGFGYGRVRVAHVALWLGFAALSLKSIYCIPFFAIVAVPLVAAQLNALSSQVELKTWGDPRSRALLIGSSLGRILCVVAVCALCVAAYPGWVHPESSNPASARQLAWGVEPEPALQKGAEQFQHWREAGQLPDDVHGVIANTDLANYVAWFAPREKVFINGRYNHHRPELPDYVAVRKGLGLVGTKDDLPEPKEALAVLKRLHAAFIAIHAPIESPYQRLRADETTSMLYRAWDACAPWYVDGRTVVFGWRPEGEPARPSFSALRVDPVGPAFGPGAARLPEPELKQPLAALGWEEAFVRPPRPAPVGAAEALGWMRFKEGPAVRQVRRRLVREGLMYPLYRTFPTSPALQWLADAVLTAEEQGVLRFPPRDPSAAADAAALKAAPVLALRAARRAIAEDPDHPDSYFALAQVLQDPDLPLTEGERALGIVTAYRQCLSRLPQPDRFRRGQFVLSDPVEAAVQLANGYLGVRVPGRIDPKTRQDIPRGYIGMPIELPSVGDFSIGELLGQGVFATDRGELIRYPFAAIRRGLVQPPAGANLVTGNTPCFLSLDAAHDALKLALAYSAADLAGEPSEAIKKRVEGIEKQLKDVENVMIRANDPYTQAKSRGANLPTLVEVALRNGLTAEGLRLLSDKDTDLAKEYKASEAAAVLQRIAIELGLGQVENASELLAVLDTPQQTEVLERAGLTTLVLLLKYQKAVQAGQYKAAGEAWEAAAGRRIGAFDKFPPAGPTVDRTVVLEAVAGLTGSRTAAEAEKTLAMLLRPTVVPMNPLTQQGTYLAWLETWNALTEVIRSRIAEQLRAESTFFYRRGVLSLMEGDIPGAKQRFLQTSRKPPPGWNVPDVVHTDARRYLRLIEMAEKKPAP